jgi:hypothetical protein
MQSVLDNPAGKQKTKLSAKNPNATTIASRLLGERLVVSGMNRLLAVQESSLT